MSDRFDFSVSATDGRARTGTIRTPRGEDIMAACGQLKSATERARKSKAQIEAEAGL